MRSFTIMTALMAAGSLAQPVNEKRAVEYVTETEVTYETVWVDPSVVAPTPTPELQAAAVAVPSPAAHGHAAAHQAVPPAPAVSSPAPAPVPAPSSTVLAVAPSAKAPAPAAAVAMLGGNGVNSLETTCLNAHNAIRAKHNVGPLSWDDDLAASAQALAATCVFGHNIELGPASGYGQNIASSTGTLGLHSKITEAKTAIVDEWYTGEAAKFSQMGLYGVASIPENEFDGVGHFTQEVWKGTTKVGCAVVACDSSSKIPKGISNGYYTVCNYNPAGNMAKEYALNVFN